MDVDEKLLVLVTSPVRIDMYVVRTQQDVDHVTELLNGMIDGGIEYDLDLIWT